LLGWHLSAFKAKAKAKDKSKAKGIASLRCSTATRAAQKKGGPAGRPEPSKVLLIFC
jgi:hypothetical protein